MKIRIKRIISVFLVTLLLVSAFSTYGYAEAELAEKGQCGEDLFWEFDSESGLLNIYGSGSMYSYDTDDAPFYSNTEIKTVVVDTGVSGLNENVFAFCSELTAVELPRGLKVIKANSFESCTKLSSVTLPSNLTTIEDEAFYDCCSLEEIELPTTLKKIGASAFESSGLKKIELPVRINEIGSQAFADCPELTEVLIYSSVSEIQDKTFAYCENLKVVSISENTEKINKAAFNGCTNLSEVYFSGRSEDWANVSIGSRNEPLYNVEMFYNCDGTHIHEYIGEITVPATCEVDGEMTYTCYCGKSYTETIPAAHVWSDWQYFSEEQDVRICEHCHGEEYRSKPEAGNETDISMNLIEETDEYAIIGLRLDSGSFSGIDIRVSPNSETIGQCEYFMETDYFSGFCRTIKKQGEYTSFSSNINTVKMSFASTAPFTASYENFVCLKFRKLTDKSVDKNDFELAVLYCYDESENQIYPSTVNNLPEPVVHIHNYIEVNFVPESCTQDGYRTFVCRECSDRYTEIIPAAHKLVHKSVKATPHSDGCEYDVCTVCFDVFNYRIIKYEPMIKAINGAVIDEENGLIYGLSVNLKDIEKYVEPAKDGVSITADKAVIGTGTTITASLDGEVRAYTAVIFGDVNGDGFYDGTDAMTVKLITCGMLSGDDLAYAAWIAADCNHDGAIDEADVDILEDAGVLLSGINQSLLNNENMETSSVYGEYLNLISQNTLTEEAPEEETVEKVSCILFFEKILYLINLLISILRFDLFIR